MAWFVCVIATLPTAAARADSATDDAEEAVLPGTTSVSRTGPAFVTGQGEYWIGIEGFRHVTSMYGGLTWAPDGAMSAAGVRFRFVGTASRYSGTAAFPVVVTSGHVIEETTELAAIAGNRATAKAMLGWQWNAGATVVKAFAGAAFAMERKAPASALPTEQKKGFGAAAALEVWHTLSPVLWASLDLAYATVDREASARARLGIRVGEAWSVGPEVAWAATTDGGLIRAGGFLRYDDGVSEASLSLGAAKADHARPSLFVGTQWLQRF